MTKVITERKPVQTTVTREENHVGEAKNSGSGKSASVGPGGTNHHEAHHMGQTNVSPPGEPSFDADREIADLKDQLQQLRSCVIDMDSMAADSLAQIMSVAKLALAYMETPAAYDNTDILADAFDQIWQTAETCGNYVTGRAEDVDISPHANTRGSMRFIALMKHRKLDLI